MSTMDDNKTATTPNEEDDDDTSTTTSNGGEGEDQETSSEPEEPKKETSPASAAKPAMLGSLVRRPPKMRIKLSLRKLPTQANRKPVKPKEADSDENDGEIKATVVGDDEAGEDDAIAAVVGEPSVATSANASKPVKRRSVNPQKAIRMPPIASPGLLMVPPSSSSSTANAPKTELKKGYVAPASVFDQTMEQAGYTTEARTKRPHRGSSVKRQVGDMFDSDVTLTLRFPPLMPQELLKPEKPTDDDTDKMDVDGAPVDLPNLLVNALKRRSGQTNGITFASSSRKRPRNFADMVPVSLIAPYPEDYLKKHAEYVEQVEARESAIIEMQETEEIEPPADSATDEPGKTNGTSLAAKVPPIPRPPTPPRMSDLTNFPSEDYDDMHPLYPPRGKASFVAHIDKDCFHITDGRYFGLASNFIADPNFVGPNAPGLVAISASGGSGLATSTSGGGISGAMALTLSTTYNGTTAGAEAALKSTTTATIITGNIKSSPKKESATDKDSPSTPTKHVGSKPTATASSLKKIFDEDGDAAKSMKECIIRAAVHASRSGLHGQSFRAPNGEIYPDISKAFATHGGIKPCERCKNNKQGVSVCEQV